MNPRVLEDLSAQRMADIRSSVASSRRHVSRGGSPQQSLRVRTGWTLVDLGLKLVAQPQPRQQRVPRPRPAGS
jgi:hypothetical protein